MPDTMTYGCESLLMWRLPDYAECPVPLPECFERALFLSLALLRAVNFCPLSETHHVSELRSWQAGTLKLTLFA